MITICIHCENFVSTANKPFPPTSCSQACHGYRNGCTCIDCLKRDEDEESKRKEQEKEAIVEESTSDRAGV